MTARLAENAPGVMGYLLERAALTNGFAVTIAEDGHSTWPQNGESADAIKTRVNAELAQAGARLSSVADLERSFI